MSSNFVEDLVRRHPLQRLSSPSRGASALLHVSPTAFFTIPVFFSYRAHIIDIFLRMSREKCIACSLVSLQKIFRTCARKLPLAAAAFQLHSTHRLSHGQGCNTSRDFLFFFFPFLVDTAHKPSAPERNKSNGKAQIGLQLVSRLSLQVLHKRHSHTKRLSHAPTDRALAR